jgi:hypothetical protein
MTLGNMRELGVHYRIGFCHNDASPRAAGQLELACTQERRYLRLLLGRTGRVGMAGMT